MGIKRRLIQLLDRPGGRQVLARLGTWYASRNLAQPVHIFHDRVWIHRIDDRYFADSPHFSYSPNEIASWRAYGYGTDRPEELWYHVYKPAAGDTIIDVGAGVGSDTIAFSKSVGDSGRVIAIEAHPGTFVCLQKTCEWNRLRNVTPLQLALMDRSRTVYIDDADSHVSNAVSEVRVEKQIAVGILAMSLDEVCERHAVSRIDLLKMNIEGAERFAIGGMERSLPKVRHVCIACHDFIAGSADDHPMRTLKLITAFLRDSGFQVVDRKDDPRPHVRDHIHGFRP